MKRIWAPNPPCPRQVCLSFPVPGIPGAKMNRSIPSRRFARFPPFLLQTPAIIVVEPGIEQPNFDLHNHQVACVSGSVTALKNLTKHNDSYVSSHQSRFPVPRRHVFAHPRHRGRDSENKTRWLAFEWARETSWRQTGSSCISIVWLRHGRALQGCRPPRPRSCTQVYMTARPDTNL
jgi:hypothetical protein